MRVFVTRPQQEAVRWVEELRARGVDAQALPLIRIVPATGSAAVADAWARLHDMRCAMFVSSNAVRFFFAAAGDSRWPAGTRAWATGPGTVQALHAAGVEAGLVDAPAPDAAQFDSEALWQRVRAQVSPGDQVLIVRGAQESDPANHGRDWLEQELAAAGARVTTCVAYLRAIPAWSDAQLGDAASRVDSTVWLFSSSQAIANLRTLLPAHDWAAARAVATHPRIAQAAREAGFGVVCVSRPSVDAAVAALESFR